MNLRPQRDWFSRPAQYQTMPLDQKCAIIEMIARKSQNHTLFTSESEAGIKPANIRFAAKRITLLLLRQVRDGGKPPYMFSVKYVSCLTYVLSHNIIFDFIVYKCFVFRQKSPQYDNIYLPKSLNIIRNIYLYILLKIFE